MKLFVFFFFTRPLAPRHFFFPTRQREERFPETRCFDYRYNIYVSKSILCVVLRQPRWEFFLPTFCYCFKGYRRYRWSLRDPTYASRLSNPHRRITLGFWSFFFFFIWITFCSFFYPSLHAAAAYTPPFVSIHVRTQRWPAPYVYYVIGRHRRNTRTKNRVSPTPLTPPRSLV